MSLNEYFFNKIPAKYQTDRVFLGLLEAWVSIVGNIILFVFKFFAGISLSSISLKADAFHSLSDCLTSIVILLSMFISKKPADKEHPYGHGRIEYIATLIIGLLLGLTAFEFGKQSFFRIIYPSKVSFSLTVILLLVISAIFKEAMASFSNFLGKKTDSQSLIGDAWHHRSDAIATMLVVISLSISPFKIYWLDGVLGLFVSLFIGQVAFVLLKDSTNDLLGKAADRTIVEKIKKEVKDIDGVLNCHDISVHDYFNRKDISIHIDVKAGLSAAEAHSIGKNVEQKIKGNTNNEVTVHIDPEDRTTD